MSGYDPIRVTATTIYICETNTVQNHEIGSRMLNPPKHIQIYFGNIFVRRRNNAAKQRGFE